jgi:hypothetical protein
MMLGGFTTAPTSHNNSIIGDRAIVDKSVTGPSKILTRKWREKDLNRHRANL